MLLLAALAGGAWFVASRRPEQVEGHAYPVPTADDRITVEVLNGSGRPGLARVATRVLRRQGLDVVYLGNGPAVDSTTVFVRRGNEEAGKLVHRALDQGRLRSARDTTRHVDVSVILGPDYREPDEVHP
ncbi:MAG TPA: LytR C-terminal domain-containing protein [Gemmatimonadales bacterium]|nr:LytR C-terminal domain-containing protein [Gemmatimonadales bacterium]